MTPRPLRILAESSRVEAFSDGVLAIAMGHGIHTDKESALILYAVISAAMAVTWLIMFTYLHRHPHLLRHHDTAAFFRTERLRAIAGIIAPLVPVLIGLRSPLTALAVIVATPVFYAATAEGLTSSRLPSPADN